MTSYLTMMTSSQISIIAILQKKTLVKVKMPKVYFYSHFHTKNSETSIIFSLPFKIKLLNRIKASSRAAACRGQVKSTQDRVNPLTDRLLIEKQNRVKMTTSRTEKTCLIFISDQGKTSFFIKPRIFDDN